MRVISASSDLNSVLKPYLKNDKSVGFVPTMGALHDGHLKLIEKSKDQNECTVVSIFVNPIQFNNQEDLANYPRVLEEDIQKLSSLEVDYAFTPDEDELYPSQPLVSIDFGASSQILEGKFRKGHFEGVGIVVSKLLHIVQPTSAYFGLKDLQQFLLIRRMCEDLNYPVNIVGVETERESSGLAMSSRNTRLSQEGLKIASNIYSGLDKIKEGIQQKRDLKALLNEVLNFYNSKGGLEIEYLEAINPKNLKIIDAYIDLDELAVCVAGYVEGIRLIDNLYLRLK